MTVRPILFSGPMVRALLEGRKTQTRRVIKPQLVCSSHLDWPDRPDAEPIIDEDGLHCGICGAGIQLDHRRRSGVKGIPVRFAVGDVLYVRESHRLTDCECTEACRGPGHVYYEADASGYRNVSHNRLRPGLHMPRWASRITLPVTDVRIERLYDISEEDCRAEGVSCNRRDGEQWCWIDGTDIRNAADGREAYFSLWEKINGAASFNANPWIAALTFAVHKQNVDAFVAEKKAA